MKMRTKIQSQMVSQMLSKFSILSATLALSLVCAPAFGQTKQAVPVPKPVLAPHLVTGWDSWGGKPENTFFGCVIRVGYLLEKEFKLTQVERTEKGAIGTTGGLTVNLMCLEDPKIMVLAVSGQDRQTVNALAELIWEKF